MLRYLGGLEHQRSGRKLDNRASRRAMLHALFLQLQPYLYFQCNCRLRAKFGLAENTLPS